MYCTYNYIPFPDRLTNVSDALATVDTASANPLLPLLSGQFGDDFLDEITDRMVGTTINTAATARGKLSNCVSYLLARTTTPDPRDSLVANLGPDEAWHTFLVYTDEYTAFCRKYAGDFIHHDPAGESALVNTEEATLKTVGLFERYGIPYTPDLWQDHITYPAGALAVRSGFMPRSVPAV